MSTFSVACEAAVTARTSCSSVGDRTNTRSATPRCATSSSINSNKATFGANPQRKFASAVCASGVRKNRARSSLTVQAALAPADDDLAGTTVGETMTTMPLVWCTPNMTVDDALELLVDARITGMPVVDDDFKVIGVVSDYDLLALDSIAHQSLDDDGSLFPSNEQSWSAFSQLQSLLEKGRGTKVFEVMTEDPVVVRPTTELHSATKILLETRIRRLPVVDEDCKLVGIVTRGSIIRTAVRLRRGETLK